MLLLLSRLPLLLLSVPWLAWQDIGVTSFQVPTRRTFRFSRTAIITQVNTNNNSNSNFNSVFPISTRQALIQRSKQINHPSDGSSTNTITSAGWSNRAATILTPVHVEPVGVYTADRPFYWNNIDVGCRATIIEMPSTSTSSSSSTKPDLFIHSPVSLDGPMIQCLQQIGNVRYICSTNYEHVKFASLWYQNYGTTTADMWGCPGLSERMPEIPWKGEIPFGYRPVSWSLSSSSSQESQASPPPDPAGIWDTSILQPFHVNMEHNPFTNRPFFNEVIYYHAPTKTLLCTDLFWNYPSANGIPNGQYGRDDTWELAPRQNDGIPLGTRVWKFAMDQIYYPFFTNFMITNRTEYDKMAHHIVHVWDVETIIPAHGDIIRGKEVIRSILTQYFGLPARS